MVFSPSRRKKHNPKHRVLIYLTCYNVLDGVTLTIRKIENEILERGHSVCVLTTKSGNIANTHIHMEGRQLYQRYRHLPNKHPNRTVIFLDQSYPIPHLHDPNDPDNSYHIGFSISDDVKKMLDEFRPTIVHMTVPDITSMHLIHYARVKQLPIMGTYHSNIPDYFAHYPGIGWVKYLMAAHVRHQYNFIQALYVPTPFIRRHLSVVDEFYQFDKVTNLNVWGRGVDLERFQPFHRSESFRARYGFSPDDVVVTWVGRLVPEKRPDIFAYVVRKLAEEGVPFKALVIGAGPNEDHMKSLNLPKTIYTGWLSGDELAVAYASSDVFLFPSAVETFGNVTLEAAASGLPLIVDSGCSGHLVQHGVNGFACNDGDMESYYNFTRCLVLDDTKRKSMSNEGRKLSLKYENKTVCGRMINNYNTITEEFYCAYNGNHASRDQLYEMKDGSFLYGSYVRPTCLILVEHLSIIFFTVVYKVSEFIQACFRRNNDENDHSAKKTSSSSPISHSVPSCNIITNSIDSFHGVSVPMVGSNRNSSSNALNMISEVEESSNDTISTDSYQDTVDSEIANPSLITMSTKSGDDETDSIESSPSGCDDTTTSSCSAYYENSNCHKRRNRLWRSELPISHNLAILFVEVFGLQARIECRIRKFCISTNNHSSKKILEISDDTIRKRKDSEEITPDDCSDALTIQLNESLLPRNGNNDCIESGGDKLLTM